MPRKVRDFVLSALAILTLAGLLLATSPDLRERAVRMTTDPQFDFFRGAAAQAFASSFGIVQGYAGDNNYLFVFMIAACVFVVLMLKVIS